MSHIETFDFNAAGLERLRAFPLGTDWPVVYILENNKEIYVGETTDAHSRAKQHIKAKGMYGFKRMHLITDELYNKSAALDMEAQLIQHMAADDVRRLTNENKGIVNHNFFDRQKYRAKFEVLWGKLKELSLANKGIADIQNSELYKYSPYKGLTEDQLNVAKELRSALLAQSFGTHIVNGGPGTGKTVLATYLVKALKDDEKTSHLKVGLVVPMTSLRKSLKDVFGRVPGLSAKMVLGPSEVAKQDYDVLIVDEAHRLRRRKGITGYGAHDNVSKKLGFSIEDGTELDWVLKKSKHQILFYDENQSIRPSDVRAARIAELNATRHHLTSQLRVKGGDKYIKFIEGLFGEARELDSAFENYDFRIYQDLSEMVTDIKTANGRVGLCRLVAGFAWPWISQKNPDAFDIQIDDVQLRWNHTTTNWVNTEKAPDEVGCIHTVQGYDLNYVAVIVGPELSYDSGRDCLTANVAEYKDTKGWAGVDDPEEIERYIINIYKTLMTRGALGCYVYFVNKDVEKYFKRRIDAREEIIPSKPVPSPITVEMVQIPLVGSAPCGSPLLGEENIEEYIPVPKMKLRPGIKYFIVRAVGDSMNLAGIHDGNLVLCRQQLKADTGDRVVSLLGDNVTIKIYGERVEGVRKLLPKSSNKKHTPITPDEGDTVQGIVQEVIEE